MKQTHKMVVLIGLLVAGCSGGSGSTPSPINAAPTISAIADQSTIANVQSNPIAFSVTDEQTGSLSIIATSDNQDVLLDENLVLSGSDASRSLTVTPVSDTLGDAMITIVVTDASGLSASSSFVLTIDPQQLSFSDFVRSSFSAVPEAEPSLINAVQFIQDAGDDDFADLLAQ